MSEAPPAPPVNSTPEAPPAPAAPADVTPEPPKTDGPLGEKGLAALQAERDARKQSDKALADALAKVKEFEDRDKSEAEKSAERLAAAEKVAVDATREALRYKIAAKHGISDDDAELFLTGNDEDTMQRQAARYAERKPAGPKPDPSQGPRPDDASDIDTQIAEATKAGNHRLAISLKRQKAYANKT